MQSTARVPTICATCQAPGALDVRQEIRGGQLRWTESFTCACGHGFETGNVGLPTPGARNAILGQSGRAEVWIDEAAAVPKVLVLLVKGLGVEEAAARARFARLPAVAYEGTHAEAAFISAALERGGVVARVVNHLPERKD
jgi:hypothetical protein